MIAFFEDLGISVIQFFNYVGGIILLLADCFAWMARGAIRVKESLGQMALLGVNSLPIVVITTGFAGMVLSLQLAHVAVSYGLTQMVGYGVAIAMAREFGPMLTAIVVAGRAGSAITAEVGSMKVTEQVDALEAMAVSPTKYLVIPRYLGLLLMLPLLALFADLAGVMGGGLVGKLSAGIPFSIYFNSITGNLAMADVWKGLAKCLVFATEIVMVGCYQGLNTKGGAAGVGIAVTGSVVVSIILVFASNFFLSYWMF